MDVKTMHKELQEKGKLLMLEEQLAKRNDRHTKLKARIS